MLRIRSALAHRSFGLLSQGHGGVQRFSAAFAVDPLPWEMDALTAKGFTKEQIDYHYNKHHSGYATKLNAAAEADASIKKLSIHDIIMQKTPQFNLAAQIYNHNFFWKCLSPSGGGEPTGELAKAIVRDFGSFEKFKSEFTAKAGAHFGSGWVWLVKNSKGTLQIIDTHDAGCPLTEGFAPLLTCDVWEHAFYIDYRHDKAKYVQNFWGAVNWEFAASNL